MSVPSPASPVGALVHSCLVQSDGVTSALLECQEELGTLPELAGTLARLVGTLMRRYAPLLDLTYEEALSCYGLAAAQDSGDQALLDSFREALALVVAGSDRPLLAELSVEVGVPVVLALAETAAVLLSNLEELDFSDPALVLSESLALL